MCKMLWEQGVADLKHEDTILLTMSFSWYLIRVGRSRSGTSQEESRITSFLGAWGKLGKEVVHESLARANGKM